MSGMPSITTRWGWRALLACGFAACLIAAHSTLPARAGDNNAENKNAENKNAPSSDAQAGDDDNNADDWIDTKIVKGILNGIGLKNTVEPGINYHERSPLVVPPTRDLPAPQVAAPQPNSAWPKDKDMTPRKVVTKKRESKPATEAEQEDMRQLRPDELRGPKAAKRTADAGPQSDPDGRSQQLIAEPARFPGLQPQSDQVVRSRTRRRRVQGGAVARHPHRSSSRPAHAVSEIHLRDEKRPGAGEKRSARHCGRRGRGEIACRSVTCSRDRTPL